MNRITGSTGWARRYRNAGTKPTVLVPIQSKYRQGKTEVGYATLWWTSLAVVPRGFSHAQWFCLDKLCSRILLQKEHIPSTHAKNQCENLLYWQTQTSEKSVWLLFRVKIGYLSIFLVTKRMRIITAMQKWNFRRLEIKMTFWLTSKFLTV